MGYGRAISKAVKQAGKQQEANTRGLSGNRNAQGDFMPEEVQMKGVQDAVTPDLQNYIEDVKAQIDDLEKQIDNQEAVVQDPTSNQEASSSELAHLQVLYANKEQLVDDLITKLEDNGIPVPEEVRDLKLHPYDRELKQRDDVMREDYESKQAWESRGDGVNDPTGMQAIWNS